jgi:hypothetical protein
VPTDLTKSTNVDVSSDMGVAGYEYPIEPSKHVILQSNLGSYREINELYCGLDGEWHINEINLTDSAGAAYIGSLELSAYADNDEFNP